MNLRTPGFTTEGTGDTERGREGFYNEGSQGIKGEAYLEGQVSSRAG